MRIGMMSYACKQGLGYLAKSFWDAGVIDEMLMIHHGKRTTYPEWYQDKAHSITNLSQLRSTSIINVLEKLDIMLFFETPFDWNFPALCSACGVKTVCMPMYEWYPKNKMDVFDAYLCPSLLDCDYFQDHVNPLFQPPVDDSIWKQRTTAKTFLHNAGNIGFRGHKGTLELLQAMEYVESDLTLTVRCQDKAAFTRLLHQVPQVRKNPKVILENYAVAYEDLFSTHDVLVAPEKFNGLSLPLQEAYAAGMLVMTTDRYPINTWLPREPLIPVQSTHKACISSQYHSFDECTIDPKAIAKTMDDWYGKDIYDYSQEARLWGKINSWDYNATVFCDIMEGLL